VEGTNSFEHQNRCWAQSAFFRFYLYPLLRAAERDSAPIQVIALVFWCTVFGVQFPDAIRSCDLTLEGLDNQSQSYLCDAITTAHYLTQAQTRCRYPIQISTTSPIEITTTCQLSAHAQTSLHFRTYVTISFALDST
jgi:hypothetical protein